MLGLDESLKTTKPGKSIEIKNQRNKNDPAVGAVHTSAPAPVGSAQ